MLKEYPQEPTYDFISGMLKKLEELSTRLMSPYGYVYMKETVDIHIGETAHSANQVSSELLREMDAIVQPIIEEYKGSPLWKDIVHALSEDGWKLDFLYAPIVVMDKEQHQTYNELERVIEEKVRHFQKRYAAIKIHVPGFGELGLIEARNRRGRLSDVHDRIACSQAIMVANNTFAVNMVENLLTNVRSHDALAMLVGYRDAMDRSFHNKHIPIHVWEEFVDSASKHCQHLWNRYDLILSKVLHVPPSTLRYDDSPERIMSDGDLDYKDALEEIAEFWGQLDPEFATVIRTINTQRRIHWLITPNRSTGAYAWDPVPGKGPFICIRYDGSRSSQKTLAHELGHAMQANFANLKPKGLYKSYEEDTVINEVHSLFSEFIYKKSQIDSENSPREKGLTMLTQCAGWMNRIFDFIQAAEFDKILHTYAHSHTDSQHAENLTKLFNEVLRQWYPPNVGLDERGSSWAMSRFYYEDPFKHWPYAVSQMIVLSLIDTYEEARSVGKVRDFAEKFKSFLAASGSKDPQELLRDSFGIELGPELYEKGFRLINKRFKEASALLDQSELIESTTGLASQGQALQS